jgi:hypothetical protein
MISELTRREKRMSAEVCPGGCGVQVTTGLVACRRCWDRLPADIKLALYRTRRRLSRFCGSLDAYRDARNGAHAWFQQEQAAARHG